MKRKKSLFRYFSMRVWLVWYEFKCQLRKIWRWMKKNWVGALLDTAVIVLAAFIGLLFGGFMGFVFVLNALLGV